MKTRPSSRLRSRVVLCAGTALVLATAAPTPALADPIGSGVPDSGASPGTGEPGAADPHASDTPQLGPGISRGPYANKIAERSRAVASLGDETSAAKEDLDWRIEVSASAKSDWKQTHSEARSTAKLAAEMASNAYEKRAREIPGLTDKFKELFTTHPALQEYDTEAIAAEAERAKELSLSAKASLDAAQASEDIARADHKKLSKQLKKDTDELEKLIEDNSAAIKEQDEQREATDRREATEVGTAADGNKPSKDAAEAVDFALEQQGKPYVWGATGPSTYDCSGLMLDAYEGQGLPRVSSDQFRSTAERSVDTENMLPGDLIFYGDTPGDWTSVYHVTMYIGDGEMVQAPQPGDVVKVSPVSFDDFVGAHRVTDAVSTTDTKKDKEKKSDAESADKPQDPGPAPEKPEFEPAPEPGREEPGGGSGGGAPVPTPTPDPN